MSNIDWSSPSREGGAVRLSSYSSQSTGESASVRAGDVLVLAVVEKQNAESGKIDRGVLLGGKFIELPIPSQIKEGEKVQVLVSKNSNRELSLTFLGRAPSSDAPSGNERIEQLIKTLSANAIPLKRIEELLLKQLRISSDAKHPHQSIAPRPTGTPSLTQTIPTEAQLGDSKILKGVLARLGTDKDALPKLSSLIKNDIEIRANRDARTTIPAHADTLRTFSKLLNEYFISKGEPTLLATTAKTASNLQEPHLKAILNRISDLATKTISDGESLLTKTVRAQIENITTAKTRVAQILFEGKNDTALTSLVQILKMVGGAEQTDRERGNGIYTPLVQLFARSLSTEIEQALQSEDPAKKLRDVLARALKTLETFSPPPSVDHIQFQSRGEQTFPPLDSFPSDLSYRDTVAIRILNAQIKGLLSIPEKEFERIVAHALAGDKAAQTELRSLFKPLLSTLENLTKSLENYSSPESKLLLSLFKEYHAEISSALSGDPAAIGKLKETLSKMAENLGRIIEGNSASPEEFLNEFDETLVKTLHLLTARARNYIHGVDDSSILPALRSALSLIDEDAPWASNLPPHIAVLKKELNEFQNQRAPSSAFKAALEAINKELLEIPQRLVEGHGEPTSILKIIDQIIRSVSIEARSPLQASPDPLAHVTPYSKPPQDTPHAVAALLKNLIMTLPEFGSPVEQELGARAREALLAAEKEAQSPSPGNRSTLRKDAEHLIQVIGKEVLEEVPSSSLSLPTLRSIDSLLSTDRALSQIAPLMHHAGQPLMILFPALLQGILSKIEVSVYPPSAKHALQDETESHSPEQLPFSRVAVSISLPSLGRVAVDCAHRPGELLANIVCQKEATVSYLRSRAPLVERALRNIGFTTLSMSWGVAKEEG